MNRVTGVLLTLLLLGGCEPAPLPVPSILSVEPEQIVEGGPAVLVVRVDAVLPVSVDYGNESVDPAQLELKLRVAGVPTEIAFADPDGTLVAPLPEGLPLGAYDIGVAMTDGREAVRGAAFSVVPASTLSDPPGGGGKDPRHPPHPGGGIVRGGLTGFQIDPIRDQVRGVPFRVTVRALGPGANTYQGELSLRANRGRVESGRPGRFDTGVLVEEISLHHPGPNIYLMIEDSLGNRGLSNSFRVRPH
ncbi:hypothetical protein [Hyalangium rubrum]|uniref:Lipoprotein n=1 Tax=Hyalangium rubrum TaxID=3103134 RepID=A0ABU5HHD8_9BACT|nr:hypothetical protein [Hyalangium sp. s54d21]MDY7232883.1 hypothetical protein [Hyalangium sp. s54d21]